MTINARLSLLSLLLAASLVLQAQDSTPEKKVVARPDLPGSFLVDFGFNVGLNKPAKGWEKGFWGSRTLNLTYSYPFQIGKSRFYFQPGIGMSMERFKWTNNYVLRDTLPDIERYDLVPNKFYTGLRKSMLVMNYFEIPLEVRFIGNPSDPTRSFMAAIGARIGVLADGHTKIKYRQEADKDILKEKWDHGMNRLRFGLTARVGVAGFGWFAHYNLTPLFQKGVGPLGSNDLTVLTVGITLNGL